MGGPEGTEQSLEIAPFSAKDAKGRFVPGPPTNRSQEPGSDDDLRVQMSWWLVGTGRAWPNLLDERLRFSGQTQPRWRVLAWARLQPGINQTLVAIVDELVRQDLLERRESKADRRIKNLYLTPAAHPIIEAISKEVNDIRNALLGNVSRSEMEICLSVLERVRNAIMNYGNGGR